MQWAPKKWQAKKGSLQELDGGAKWTRGGAKFQPAGVAHRQLYGTGAHCLTLGHPRTIIIAYGAAPKP